MSETKILVTGANGFIGKNLIAALNRRADIDIIKYDVDSTIEILEEGLAKADVVCHLAGINRPERVDEFKHVNFDLTQQICDTLRQLGRAPLLLLSSSTQAAFDNPYGISKRQAEEVLAKFASDTGAITVVFRLPGVFGKWCRPNYNSVVATFCHNIARELPITISDPAIEVELVYIDDVVCTLIRIMNGLLPLTDGKFHLVKPTYRISLGRLSEMIQGFRDSRFSLALPAINDPFVRSLYSTYNSYLPTDSFAYALTQRADLRGELAEFLKSPCVGQIFVSRTRPGVTRGNHYHDTKVEKFLVLEGDALIRFRQIFSEDIIEYPVSGREFRVTDIPPGYTHSIENIGQTDLIVLFWAAEIFDPDIPDTFAMSV